MEIRGVKEYVIDFERTYGRSVQLRRLANTLIGGSTIESLMRQITPVKKVKGIYMKRDDLFVCNGERGGKARSSLWIASQKPKPKGLVTAGSRRSPQITIVAAVAKYLNVPCVVFTPKGKNTPEIDRAKSLGAKVKRTKTGYNVVLEYHSRTYAEKKRVGGLFL